jgi:hypothetical protein
MSSEERDAGRGEPQRPGDVRRRGEALRELPAGGFVAADELERADHEERSDDEADDAGPDRDGAGLRQGCAGERRPCSREAIPEVLADGHAEVAVERLEDDVDGLAAAGLASGSAVARAR